MARHSLWIVVALGLSSSTLAFAQRRALDLHWSAPTDCPSADAVLAQVGELRDLAGEAPLEVTIRIEQSGDQYLASLTTARGDVRGERTISDPDCTRLAQAAAVVIAIALEEASEPEPIVMAPVTPRTLYLALSPRVIADLGIVGAPSAGLGVGLSVISERLVRVELWGSSWLPTQIMTASAGARVQMIFLGGARGCVQASLRDIELGGCGGVELGLLEATAFGISDPATNRAAWLGLSAGPVAWLHFRDAIWARIAVEVVLPVLRPEFPIRVLHGDGTTSNEPLVGAASLAGRLEVGIEWRF